MIGEAGHGRIVAAALLAAACASAHAEDEPAPAESEELRERLTTRSDEKQVEHPLTIDVRGRPLTITGKAETTLDFLDAVELGRSDEHAPDRLLFQAELEAEAFYSFGPRLSLFGQLRVAGEHDLHRATPDRVSDVYLERGETWLVSEHIGGSGVSIEAGRLDFEDDRTWWWDDDHDAVRVTLAAHDAEVSVALARELGPRRLDRDFIEPQDDKVQRVIVEGSWDFADNHALEAFALVQRDRSRREREGDLARRERADAADGDLRWLGVRASGAWDGGPRGLLGYWIDLGRVRGDERTADFEDADPPGYSVADEVHAHRVRGWALDAGATWVLALPRAPRITLAYASGSGDRDPDDALDQSFHQTGLQSNTVGFGGVERFTHYGVLLDPELSNLAVRTVGVGMSLLESSSLDLVAHRYRLREPADGLRDANVDLALDERHRGLGDAVDLVLAIEEGARVELELTAGALRQGDAFRAERGEWRFGAFVAVRVAF